MATKEEKKKLIDILSGKNRKFLIQAKGIFKDETQNICTFIGSSDGRAELYVEFVVLAESIKLADKRANQIINKEGLNILEKSIKEL